MGTSDYLAHFTALDVLRVHVRYDERGSGVVEFTVQYEAEIDGVYYPVARYDTAHGHAHRDLLDADGRNTDKLWLPGWDYKTALDHALADLKAHWPQYRADFIARLSK